MYGIMTKSFAPTNKLRRQRGTRRAKRHARPGLESLEARTVLSGLNPYLQTNLVSDVAGLAQITDPNLVNPWGVSFSATSPFWVSNQGTNTATLYNAETPTGISKKLTVSIPTTASGAQGPTGQVNNSTSSFLVNGTAADFIFANLNGTISAWNGGTTATVEATTPGASYTGLAIATNTAGSFLYAANDAQDRIDVFNGSFTLTQQNLVPNAFVDPKLPTGLVPFDVKLINGDLFVTYAPAGHTAQVDATPGQGAVATFTTSGKFLSQLITGGKLASPWGITLASAGFGAFSGDLLVGNFASGDSDINAFDPSTGAFRGTLTDATGQTIFNPDLWTLTFGNGVTGDANTLYFTAGIDGEKEGLFGSIQAVPPLSSKAPIVPNLPNGAFQTLTTVPANGDTNPYGVAVVPNGFPSGGKLNPGDILVSNFNNSVLDGSVQGTGTTIVRITPQGQVSTFFTSTSTGLDTALAVLKSGFVIVGNVPTTDGTFGTITQGSLQILNSSGTVVKTLTDSTFLAEPWDLAVNDQGDHVQVFVSNLSTVAGDTGTVTRLDLTISPSGTITVGKPVQIASGYKVQANTAAVVLGPTGLAFDAKKNVLYVASTADNEIFAIPNAATRTSDDGTGSVVFDNAHLRGPLGLVLAPNGDLITANGDAVNADMTKPSELVEFTPEGQFVGEFSIDSTEGSAFGLAVSNVGGVLRLAAVDDTTNSLDVWTFDTRGRSSKWTGAFSV